MYSKASPAALTRINAPGPAVLLFVFNLSISIVSSAISSLTIEPFTILSLFTELLARFPFSIVNGAISAPVIVPLAISAEVIDSSSMLSESISAHSWSVPVAFITIAVFGAPLEISIGLAAVPSPVIGLAVLTTSVLFIHSNSPDAPS